MLDLSTSKGRIVAAALRLAGERSWNDVTLADIAKSAQVSLLDLRRDFGSKAEILAAFVRAVDDEVLAGAPERDTSQPPRDAIFEVVMRRFDVLASYKPALQSISESWPPEAAVVRALAVSQAWMLRAAGIAAEGLEGQLRTVGLAAVYASVFRTWLNDDDPGLARTMAVLDRRLRRGERTLNTLDEIKSRLCSLAGTFTSARKRASGAEPKAAPDTPPAASA
jgi:ubiquinone biosynthesis protein COQ9